MNPDKKYQCVYCGRLFVEECPHKCKGNLRKRHLQFKIMKENVTRFKQITDNMVDIYQKKNQDYGNSFGQSVAEHGAIAGIVRIGDKYNRAKQLLVNKSEQQVSDESAIDTLLDLANYAIMLAMEIDKE